MKKQQAVNLWRELQNSTDKETVLRKLNNKPGYGGKRTLTRYSQVDEGLRQGESMGQLNVRTGWSNYYLTKVCTWWEEEFGVKGAADFRLKGTSVAELSAVSGAEDLARREKHNELVLAPLANLVGIEPFPLHDWDLMNFYTRPETPSWPIPKGRIWRDANGDLAAHLRCEHDCEILCEDDPAWLCLCQHLEKESLEIVDTKRAIESDISDRLAALSSFQERADLPEGKGGTGLKLLPHMGYSGEGSQYGYGPYFLFTLLHQGMCRILNVPLGPKRKKEFRQGPPGTVELGSYPVIQAADTVARDRAIDWLLRMQDQVVNWPETVAATESYSRALAACRTTQRQLRRLQLQAGLPAGSRCEVCQYWPR